MKPSILIISDSVYLPPESGLERVLYEQARRLILKGYYVVVLCRNKKSKVNEIKVIDGIETHIIGTKASNPIFEFVRSSVKAKAKIKEFSKKNMFFDAVLFEQPLMAYILRSILKRRMSQARLVYNYHSPLSLEYLSHGLKNIPVVNAIFFNLLNRLEKKSISQCSRIIFHSDYMKQQCLELHHDLNGSSAFIIPLGVDLVAFQCKSNTKQARVNLKIENDRIVAFTLRNLEPRMGIVELIDCWKDIVQKYPDVLLVVGGEGELKKAIRNKIDKLGLENNIFISGRIPENQMNNYFQAADFFVLPTLDLEGFGLVILESLACGTPVVGTPVGAIPETLSRFSHDLLFKSIHKADLISFLDDFIEKRKWEKYPPDYCRQFVESQFSWENHIDKLERIIFEK